MEGVLLIFIGVLVELVASVAPAIEKTAVVVYRSCASVLVVMAGISLATGAHRRSADEIMSADLSCCGDVLISSDGFVMVGLACEGRHQS